jgi:hypothetical protein
VDASVHSGIQKWLVQLPTSDNFGWLPDDIKRLETQGLPLQESMDVMKNASGNLSDVRGEAGENVSTKLQAVLKKKPCIFDIYQRLSST